MTVPDIINGSYEFLGGIAVWANVRAIIRDKGYAGVRIYVMAFFSSWSFWNLYYYPYLNQWASFIGGLSIGLANLAFVIAMLYYGKKKMTRSEKIAFSFGSFALAFLILTAAMIFHRR